MGTLAAQERRPYPAGANGSGSAQFAIPITVGCYVDANGTDYFDFVANNLAAGMAAPGGGFTAFPLTGIQGPPGPVGVSRRLLGLQQCRIPVHQHVVAVVSPTRS